MDNKSYTSTEEFPFPAMEPIKMKCLSISATETMLRSKKRS